MTTQDKNDLVVTEVVASEHTAQVQVGDVVKRINGRAASAFLDVSAQPPATSYNYEIVSAQSGDAYTVSSTVPIGLVLQPSSAFLVDALGKDAQDEHLYMLWERGDWDALEQGLKASALNPLLAKAVSFVFRKDIVNTPAKLLTGILAQHRGDKAKAQECIKSYMDKGMDNYTTNFHTLAFYYYALLVDDPTEKQHYLQEANEYNGSASPHMNALLREQGLELVEKEPFVGGMFPLGFRLERFEQDGVFDSLEELIAQGEQDLTPICVMPGYRANGPYSETMAAYATMYPYFSRHLNPMVVLLDDVKYSSTAHWTKNEQKALDAGLPLVRLKDYDNELTFALGQTVSPVVYVVQRNGKIVYQGQLDAPIDYWRLLQENGSEKATV